MATYRQRGERWQVQVRVKGQATSKSFRTKAEAKAWAREQEIKLERRHAVVKETLGDVIDLYLENCSPNKYKENCLEWWRSQLGKYRLEELRKADFLAARKRLQAMTSRKGQPLAPATVNRRMAAISSVLSLAVEEWALIENNPARVQSLPENNKRDRVLTDAELTLLIDKCRTSSEPALLPLVLCAVASGARAGELIGLSRGDLDLDRGIAIARDTKNGDTRVVPITGAALSALRDYLNAHPVIGNGLVFRNHRGSYFHYRRAWDKARLAAGLDDLRFHDLRHCAASNLARSGASLAEIGAVLGHRTAETSKRYAHYVTEHISQLGETMASFIKT